MSAILAIFQRDGRPITTHENLDRMLAASSERAVDGQDIWMDGHVAMAHQHFWITPEEWGEKQPLTASVGRLTITADVRIDNRNELLSVLNLDKKTSDAIIILEAYRRWGIRCVSHLLGDFSFAIWDNDQGQLFLARDTLGTRGLCYFVNERVCLAGSEIRQLLAHSAVESVINDSKVAEYLGNVTRNQDESFYKDIFYCPPAHCILISANTFRKWCYWKIDPQTKIRYRSDAQYADHFEELLTSAIRSRLRTNHLVGISMSGGLDSTILAAFTALLLSDNKEKQSSLLNFSYVFDEFSSCDERQFIKPVVQRWGLEATFVACDHLWTFRNIQDWPFTRSYIFSDPYARLPLAVAEAAKKKGCRVLFAGYFGDILFINGRNWAASMLGDLRLKELASQIFNQRECINLHRDLYILGLRQLVPHKARNLYRRKKKIDIQEEFPGLHDDLALYLKKLSRKAIIDDEGGKFSFDQWERFLNLTQNTLSQGFSATRFLYNRYSLELSLPYWDRRLVEFIMAIPADQLGRPGRSRWLLRNTGQHYLPEIVSERKNRTSFRPLMEKGLINKKHHVVKKLIEKPLIVEKNYVKGDWMREQFADGHSWFNSNHHVFLWKALCLELWLKKLGDPQASVFR